ncbi:MAG: 4-hydroxy-tetrahydrodipicolinate synthase [Oscillospiraceae bacterium]|nr:4-hydroxy-tetrahydrodipicolinate synthase [Oscillospiraceae bacterium]
MKKVVFIGAGVAIVTPFAADGSVNYTKLGELIDHQIENGTDAIVASGTTGEASTLNDEEHIGVIEFSVKHTAGRVPVIGGTGSNDTRHAVKLTREAARVGADAILCVTPYYNKTSQNGLIRHYNMVADSTDLPMILYNVPARTGMNITPATYAELSKHPNIVATKEANGDIASVAMTRDLCGDQLHIYSGNDDFIVPALSLGGKGVISVMSNILPKQTRDIIALWNEGKIEESAALQIKYMSLIKLLFADVSPAPVKEALNFMGKDVGQCRMPLTGVSDDLSAKLKTAIEKL